MGFLNILFKFMNVKSQMNFIKNFKKIYYLIILWIHFNYSKNGRNYVLIKVKYFLFILFHFLLIIIIFINFSKIFYVKKLFMDVEIIKIIILEIIIIANLQFLFTIPTYYV